MKLTKAQLKELYNQHTGTGYILVHNSDNNIRIVEISLGRNNQWHTGGGRRVSDVLSDLALEIGGER